MNKNSSGEKMWALSLVGAQIKSAEIKFFRSCEMFLTRRWHVQAADSVDTEGKSDLCEDLLLTRQKWPLADCANSRARGLCKETSKDKKVDCRLLTHLGQPQVHFQFGSFSGHRHKKETIAGANKKYKVKNGIKTKNGREVTLRNLMLFLISTVLSGINKSKYLQKKAVCMFS